MGLFIVLIVSRFLVGRFHFTGITTLRSVSSQTVPLLRCLLEKLMLSSFCLFNYLHSYWQFPFFSLVEV